MRKTLIALAVAGTASLAYAHNATYTSRTPGAVITGQTDSGPVFSFGANQLSGVYDEGLLNAVPVSGAVASTTSEPVYGINELSVSPNVQLSSIDGSSADSTASVSRTWFFPDGSVAYETPSLSMSNGAMSSDDLMASSSWGDYGQPTDVYVISQAQPDYLIIYGQ